MSEIWAQFQETPYEVSNFGRVRRNGNILSATQRDDGYWQVALSVFGKVKRYRVHRIVAEVFYGPIAAGQVVNHLDGNPSNNHLRNLQICTPQENTEHAFRVLQVGVGSHRKDAKLTEELVAEIRRKYKEDPKATQRSLAEEFGISLATLHSALHGKTWRHV